MSVESSPKTFKGAAVAVTPVRPEPSPVKDVAVTVPSISTFSEIRIRDELSALIVPVNIRLSSITTPVESSDLIMLVTRSPSITTLPVPFGDIVMSVFVNVELIVLPLISMALPVES